MTTREYLDAAIREADDRGSFNPGTISRQFQLTKPELGKIAADLRGMKLVSLGRGHWQLLGIAREMAVALSHRNTDRRRVRPQGS